MEPDEQIADDDWTTTLPQIARHIDVPDSTLRRWAASFDGFLPSRGRGAGRRFDPVAISVLERAKALYSDGLGTEQVVEALRSEFPEAAPPVRAHRPTLVAEAQPTGQPYLNLLRDMAERAAESPAIEAVERLAERMAALEREVAALTAAIDAFSDQQQKENARFRAVLGALVDLVEVQDQTRRMEMGEQEKRANQNHSRAMIALQELLALQRRRS